jgi:phage terminase large subunit-like protein
VWFDEEPPKDIYDECLMRIMDVRGSIWGTMTPLKGLTWVYDTIWVNDKNNPEVWVMQMTWEDNPYLSKAEIEHMEGQMTEEELESRREGRFVAITGLVYKEFREELHVIEPFDVPNEWKVTLSIDPGIDVPLSCHWYAVDHDGNVFVCGEWYRAGWAVSGHMREIERISTELDWPRDSRGHLSCLMDAAADLRSLANEQTVAQLFRDKGLNVNTNVNKSRFAGIERVKEYLEPRKGVGIDPEVWPKGKPKLFIFSTCKYMIQEIKKYRWKSNCPGGNETPEDKDDHAMDELRYFIMTRPTPYRFKEQYEKTVIQKDKERKTKALLQRRRLGIAR